MSEPRLRVLSLGAGVQSTTLALMAAHGEIGPMPDCAIFADTQGEPEAVYEHLRWLMSPNVLPFPIYIVTAGNLTEWVGSENRSGKVRVDIPAYVPGADGRAAPINRSCTRDFKIVPIRRKVRELLGIVGKRSPKTAVVEQWIGISRDEAQRMKSSNEIWRVNRWPLIEKLMSRADCLSWMERMGYPRPPKSSCTFCPFHDDEQWRDLTPVEFAGAVEVDKRLRNRPRADYRAKGALFLHRSLVPLDVADLRPALDRGPNLFNNECEGMCGV